MPVTRHSFRSATLAALLAGIALACPVQVSATQQDLFELSLEELGNIAITGPTLTKKKLSNVPASVTVFTRDEIRQLPVSTIEQLMNYVPGFQSARSSDNSMGQPYSVRGRKFGVSGREVLVMINGMRIENFFTGGGANTYPAIPLANIARVEFIRGPGSALYGSNALTGMINIITDEAHNHLGANAGDPEQATVNWLQQLDTAGIDGSLFLQGYRHNGEDYQVQDTFSPNIISTHDPQRSSDALLQLTFNRHTRLQLLAAERDINDFYVTGFLSDGFSHYDTRYYHGLLEHTLAWSDAITSSFQAGYSHFSMPVNSQATPAGALAAISAPSSTDPLQFRSEVVTNETWMRWLNDWKMGDSKSLQFGLSYRNPGIDSALINSNFDLDALYRRE
ncbi:MAG: TonB-dependent receptor plug domain-containing protein, partial [Pseudomonadota bacterium]